MSRVRRHWARPLPLEMWVIFLVGGIGALLGWWSWLLNAAWWFVLLLVCVFTLLGVGGWFGRVVGTLAGLRKERAATAKLLAISGVTNREVEDFLHVGLDTGIALNMRDQSISLVNGAHAKKYKYSDIRAWGTGTGRDRKWRTPSGILERPGVMLFMPEMEPVMWAMRNTGLFIRVRDIDRPEWQVLMNKAAFDRWDEILTQEIKEGGVSKSE